MPELRWSLLALGVLFIVGLVLWERRKGETRDRAHESPVDEELPEPLPVADSGERLERVEREPLRKPPLVEIGEPALGTLPRFDDAAERAARWLAETQPSVTVNPVQRPSLKVDWPADNARRIVALRVVPQAGEKFAGGAVRQALLGEGFELGDFDIFHLPLEDGRVAISAANLTKPGTFRLATMDAEMFSGLNLFAVLPGPLPATDAHDRLLMAADLFAQRLRGEVRDHQGQPLTEARMLELRRELAAWQQGSGAGV